MAEEYIIGSDAQFNENVDVLGKLNLFDSINQVEKFVLNLDSKEKLRITPDSVTFTDTVSAPSGNFSGIVTATKFSGPLDGMTGNFTGIITATGLDINGNADVSGNLSVGGVVTYEDVTNVDSVGIITSGHGLRVTKGGINVNAGISTFNGAVTATSFSGNGSQLTHTIPTGGIIMWSGAADNIPNGFLLCTAVPVSRTTYAALFAVISTIHGAGDGSSTFNVPNLQNRFVVGQGTYAVAATGGSANATIPYHYHNFPGDDQLSFGNGVAGWASNHDGNFGYDATSTNSGGGKLWRTTAVGESAVNKNLPPYYALCFIIKT